MVKPVKKRAYSSALRAEHAAQTRIRILQAAGELFEANGYARTTIREIAEAADVASDTVYAVFGTKGRVLTSLIDLRLAPAGDVNVLERAGALAVRDEPDQRRQLHLFAGDIAEISARVRPVYEILRTASAVEPEMAAIYAEMEGHRLRNMQQAASWIAERGHLRVSVETAAEVIWALAAPDLARMLCDGRGWTNERYAAWLEDTLVCALLPPAGLPAAGLPAAGLLPPAD
jgi:AcrR family transcriptional regulator